MDFDGILSAMNSVSVHSEDVPIQSPNFQDNEMLSWLQFPVDDTIEKGLQVDLLRGLSSSHVQIVKRSLDQLGLQQESAALSSNPLEFSHGDLPPFDPASMSSHDVPRTLCRTQEPLSVDRSWQCTVPIAKSRTVDTVAPSGPNLCPLNSSQQGHLSSSPRSTFNKPCDSSLSPSQPTPRRNFTHFSSTVAETRANLCVLGVSSGPTSIERARQHYSQGRKNDADGIKSSPLIESTSVMGDDGKQTILPQQPILFTHTSDYADESGKDENVAEDNMDSSHMSNTATTTSNKAVERLNTTEQIDTSQSQGSGSSSDEKVGKEMVARMKERSSAVDGSECHSEELEEIRNSSKKPLKRSRAAEMHNLCERKRRDRINEKLLALRDLMPNSNKTAKSSILDEAIEYIKSLQVQLQAWSVTTAICTPPSLIPNMGMHHLQVPALPHVGLGMGVGMGVRLGMGMGMGIGLMDVRATAMAAGQTMVHMPSYLRQPSLLPSHPMATTQQYLPTANVVETEDSLKRAQIADQCNSFAPQQGVQVQPFPMNLTVHRNTELYNSYMNWHLQQQLQLHEGQPLMQHQQQQHSQCNNVNE
ncbi:hypothetical protein KP509_12G021200 [Ceratopteris richardii]|uniref:BHLH domain-containing protein n=1 Tax=Ceratopteris richardii TaxID=49495 RepID=A0A8T2TJS4_CERRI|nr:hypothetical protein KP509_12G021200 [Ceratopteris richardii]KAH7422702.1 hypothetical protein KP509_12G021200 [Ceratopteris richardii]KAH7422704.1 hypothetical protein KP509_12G021200 [Ceratopteris richardii]KAH7422705.1 hypothetical protein KP509_12G021200 [Ceratopteris richardii]